MRFLTVLSLLLVAVTMATSLSHALEWPGKRRVVDGWSPALDVGGAHGLLADDAPDQQLLGQGRGHIGGWVCVLLDICEHTNRRLDGTARRLGTLARGQSMPACAGPDSDRHGDIALSIGPTYEQTSCPQLLDITGRVRRRPKSVTHVVLSKKR